MKKGIIAVALLGLVFQANAQESVQIQNKKGVDIMPEKGDFAIGFNALPILTYVGDLFGYAGSNTVLGTNKFVSPMGGSTVFGKYMLFDNQAIRAHFGFRVNANTYLNAVDDNMQVDPLFEVEDSYSRSNTSINFGAGYEWRRGTNRLRGIYGGELFFQYSSSSEEYTYGNAFADDNVAPTATVWSPFGTVSGEFNTAQRIVSTDGANVFGAGLRAFAGVEYFFAPKICVGSEFGWAAMYRTQSTSSTTVARWQTTSGTGAVVEESFPTLGNRGLSVGMDNFNGAIYLMFYF